MTAPFFSVVIPTYNHARFLRDALNSVLVQTDPDFEVLVVNNYSTDDTVGVIESLRDPRIRRIDFANHGVIGASRNVGILESRGEYIAFLDSDDLWYPDKLSRVREVLDAPGEIDVVCHEQVYRKDGRIWRRSRYRPPRSRWNEMYDYLLFVRNCLSPSATTVRRSKLLEVGLFAEDRELVTVEDYDLWLKLAENCRFWFLPYVLGEHLIHGENASHRALFHAEGALRVLKRHFAAHPSMTRGRIRRRARRREASVFYGTGRLLERQGDMRGALAQYGTAIRTAPDFWRTYPGLALFLVRSMAMKLAGRTGAIMDGRQ
jgi:glycosyltransferase involved in cell wall biosynthesis